MTIYFDGAQGQEEWWAGRSASIPRVVVRGNHSTFPILPPSSPLRRAGHDELHLPYSVIAKYILCTVDYGTSHLYCYSAVGEQVFISSR
jgi:hypothetical protein